MSVKIDKTLLESSPDKILVRNTAAANISSDVTPELILEHLRIENCAKVTCKDKQESAVAAISENVAVIGESDGEEISGIIDEMNDMLSTKIINADSCIM